MRSPIRYPGGKGLKTDKLLPLIPPHHTYCEPFGGGASLLLAKEPSKLEVYNDLNHGLVSLFRVLRDPVKFQQLYFKVNLTLYSREEYYDCRDTWYQETDELEIAYKYYVMARQWVAGRNYDKTGWLFNVSGRRDVITGWLTTLEGLPDIYERMRAVQVDCLDFRKFFKRYDGMDTFMYIDPPYWGVDKVYEQGFSVLDHEQLVELVAGLQCKVMLSNYRNELYDMLLDYGWSLYEFDTYSQVAAGRSSNPESCKRVEAVYTNYEL